MLLNSKNNYFEKTYEKYITPVYRYVYSQVKHQQEAEDLTHDIFVKAFKAKTKNKTKIELKYLFTIARRTIIDFWRKKKEVIPAEPDKVFKQIADNRQDILGEIETKEIAKEIADEINMIIGELNDTQKDVIIMKFLEGMSTGDVAEIINKKKSAVRKIQSRALAKIRNNIRIKQLSGQIL